MAEIRGCVPEAEALVCAASQTEAGRGFPAGFSLHATTCGAGPPRGALGAGSYRLAAVRAVPSADAGATPYQPMPSAIQPTDTSASFSPMSAV